MIIIYAIFQEIQGLYVIVAMEMKQIQEKIYTW